jgi:hypothetical protein
MTANVVRRERLSRFVDLARVYRGWNKTELSAALGRDPTKLVPESGNPKLDLVVGIAEALDWTVGDVAESVWREPNGCSPEFENLEYLELNRMSLEAHRGGDWVGMLRITKAMSTKSQDGNQRALAMCGSSVAYDGMGRFSLALKSVQDGLCENGVSERVRIMLQTNLANSHYALWHLVEARSIANELIEQLEQSGRTSRLERSMCALARYVRGNARRRMLTSESSESDTICRQARADLEAALEQYSRLAEEYQDDSYRGVANTCRAGLLEIDAASGALSPADAVQSIEDGLDAVIDPDAMPIGDQLESWGWWAIFGCNITLRHLDGEELHHHMAIFTNKAIEIAERLGNWSMRERAFTLEHFRRQQAKMEGVPDQGWPLDEEDIRIITGTMGRFPSFREVGWQILRGANVLESD